MKHELVTMMIKLAIFNGQNRENESIENRIERDRINISIVTRRKSQRSGSVRTFVAEASNGLLKKVNSALRWWCTTNEQSVEGVASALGHANECWGQN